MADEIALLITKIEDKGGWTGVCTPIVELKNKRGWVYRQKFWATGGIDGMIYSKEPIGDGVVVVRLLKVNSYSPNLYEAVETNG